MSTRDSMRRELKELAKLAETMGKESPADAVAQGNDSVDFPAAGLERPMTPASSSRVSVAPFATPMTPPVFDIGEPKKRSGARTGIIAVVVGASLAAALVGGAYVGRSLAGGSASAVTPVTAAAAMAPPQAPVTPQAEVAAAAPPVAAPQAPSTPDPVVPAAAATPAPKAAAAAAPAVHKHVAARPAAVAAKASVAAAAAPAAPANAGDNVAAAKPAAGAALGKPKPAAASAGGGDSLEDLIRKEVAGQKK